MKRAFVYLSASVGLLAACSDLNETDFIEKDACDGDLVESVIFEVPVIYAAEETRASLSQEGDAAIHFGWESTDTVGIFPNKGSQVYFEVTDGVGTNSAHFDGGAWALRQESTYSCYYPFVCDMKLKRDAIPVSFTGQAQNGVSTYSNIRFVLASKGTSSSSGSLHFTFQMLNTIFRIKAIGLPAGTYTKLTLEAEDPVFVQEGTFGLDDLKISGKTYSNTLELSLKDVVLKEASTETDPLLFYLSAAPVDLSGKTVTVRIYSEDGEIYQCEKKPINSAAGSWTGWKCEMKSSSTAYTKASSITVGETYLIVDADDGKLFKGASNGSYMAVSPKDYVITDTDGSLAGYEFTVERDGDRYYLKFNDGKYLVCNYNGNSTSGLAYVNTRSEVTYPYALTTGNNGAFYFSTTQMNAVGNTNQVLYFKKADNVFKIGGSGTSIGVHLYMKNGKLNRGLGFNPESVTCTLGDIPEKPVLSGTYTAVTYSSSDESIAKVDADGNVTPVAPGIVTITATAAEDDQYSAGSAAYILKIKSGSTSGTYVRVTSTDQINLDGEYVIAYDNGTIQKAFMPVLKSGNNAFSTSSDNAVDVFIIDDVLEAEDADACRFALANQDGTDKKYSLVVPEADGKNDYYFLLNYNNSVFIASTTETTYRCTFALSPEGKLTLTGSNSYKLRYEPAGNFTAGTGASNDLYLFVRADGPAKQKQSLSFSEPTVSWALGDDYEIGRNYAFPQLVSGAQTPVTYTAEPESVAKVEGGKIKIVGSGSATISATAESTDNYYAATASYTLRILNTAPGGWVALETFNLENKALRAYLDAAIASYSDTDDATNTVMPTYCGTAYSDVDRKDCPAPVTIRWTNAASGSTVIDIYEDQTLSDPVWSQNATEMSTSADVYNLIPGRTYYYTVSENSTIWEKGYFNTTGRRRMIKVSDTEATGHANNCRDLGGLEVTDNGTKKNIKYGYLFRGTNMDKTTNTEKSLLTDFLKIRLDVDLRSGSSSSVGMGENGSSNCYQPLSSSLVEYVHPGFNSFTDLTTNSKIQSVLTAIFNTAKSGNATYFHCYIGADRTGYIAMLIEGLLGVSEKDCSIDYEITSFSEAAELRYRTGEPKDYYFRQGIAFLRKQTGNTFQEKVENYLVNTVKISKTDIEEFKSIVLE